MTRRDLYLVIEALKSAHTELQTLIEDDIHVPSGDLLEQLEEAIEITENTYAQVQK